VALDASAGNREAARAAAALARALGVELAGLFVEDANLVRLAGLPFARQIPVSGGPARPVEREALEAQLRALAAAARQDLARAASSVQVTWTFEVRRGALPAEVLAAAGEADLLLLGAGLAALARDALEGRLVEPPDRPAAPRSSPGRPALALVMQEDSPFIAGEGLERLLADLGLRVLWLRRSR
jgi:hypothetical protein